MDRFHTSLVAEGLIAYAIERQTGIERYQQKGFPPWAERRRLWTDAILQGMAKLEGETPDPKLMERYDHELEATRWSSFTVPASPQLQQKTIRNLRRFVSALEFAGGDRRRQVNMVWKLLDDMSSHLPWMGKDNSLDRARDEAECALFRMTAQLPICFTRVLLGGDAGPHWVSGFVSGSVTDADAVKRTAVYREALQQYPEVKEWPALCTVCVGRDLPSAIGSVSACAFDLEIMNRIGDRFLKEQGVQQVYARQMTISASPAMLKSWASIQHPLLQGNRSLTAADLDVRERIGVEDERINFRLDVLADEKSVFGRQLSSEVEDSYIQAYTSYMADTGRVDDTLDIVVRSPGGDEWFSCALTDEARESLWQKLDTFCVNTHAEHLPSPPVQDEPVPHQMGPIM
jgi:hypothetical protein|nr:hypothetical protein [uncultured Oscillibacter sp.]